MSVIVLADVVQAAARSLAVTHDNKVFVEEEEMKALLMAPDSVCNFINNHQVGGGYVTEVTFLNMRFITVTSDPIDFGPVAA